METYRKGIELGETALGIELGSTRIKAVLTNRQGHLLASGSYDWENSLVDGIWIYDLKEVWTGLSACYRVLVNDVKNRYGVDLVRIGAIGISAMMHGYLVFDENEALLVPFRTWRNTMTEQAARKLTALFQYNIPQRWSIAHLYQACLSGESHVSRVRFMTTLAGYVHWKLTGEKVLGVGDASGMFPIDEKTGDYRTDMVDAFNELAKEEYGLAPLETMLPRVLMAGQPAGILTEAGARLLDEEGVLTPGIPFCPPEGDAGTGMVATNSVASRTGNVSAGTSIFAMVVLERALSSVYPEIDLVTTPAGKPVAMVHCNNCTSDINAWVSLFAECLESFGCKPDKNELYNTLFHKALQGEKDCGGLLAYNYLSGEHLTGLSEGRPMFVRKPDSVLSLGNFMRTHLLSALGTLRVGLEILSEKEKVTIESMMGHGGFFKTDQVGQQLMAAAVGAPVTVMETAGEGGAWGIALLAGYCLWKKGETPEAYLQAIFSDQKTKTVQPEEADVQGFAAFMSRYRQGLALEKIAVERL